MIERIQHKHFNGIRDFKMTKFRCRFVKVQVAHRQFGLTKMWKQWAMHQWELTA
jgi:hypothetical protein